MILLGYRIKEARIKAGLTQTALAHKSGVSRATIWALETNAEHITTTKTLQSLAKALNTTVDALFAQEG